MINCNNRLSNYYDNIEEVYVFTQFAKSFLYYI